MAKRSKGPKTRFVRIDYVILNSPAFMDLSAKAVRVYIEIIKRFNGHNNGEISLSCREAAKIVHGSPETGSKVLKELQEHGFIKLNREGIFTVRLASTWVLTHLPYNNYPPLRSWQQWVPHDVVENLKHSTSNRTHSAPQLTVVVSNAAQERNTVQSQAL